MFRIKNRNIFYLVTTTVTGGVEVAGKSSCTYNVVK